MNKKSAMRSFIYWANQIITPTGKINTHAEKMRKAWAKAIDSGFYRKLPDDPIEADRIIRKKYHI